MNPIKRRLRDFHERFINLRGEPGHIAMGMAIGVFIGVTPTIPFHTVLIIAVGVLFKQNIMAGYLGSWLISNPLTIPLFYFYQYELGRILLGIQTGAWVMPELTVAGIMNIGWHILIPLLVGGVVSAPFFAIPAYFFARRLAVAGRHREAA
ncbi:MAG TPA: DUF2062 domain-containing protein [Syntrophales bacterium]|nr:DUF2062 domain-containing protein [Syntrophales bacterium]HOH72355.1 DUF2062 domain-containing protein [Syntrophales bacterium]HPN08772.1 DUF2062 domain-containing protein [Syntrophales bacterium]HPX80561.1 DUF2062 domain-containing protein [Syntrophales bacterium]HQB14707.1 DUF2062 domain-containing protein [Syntrophales bacterium]